MTLCACPMWIYLLRGEVDCQTELYCMVGADLCTSGLRVNLLFVLVCCSHKDKYPALFKDVCFYSQVASLLEYYHFRVHVRRFIQHLFDECDFAAVSCVLPLTEIRLLHACFFGQ